MGTWTGWRAEHLYAPNSNEIKVEIRVSRFQTQPRVSNVTSPRCDVIYSLIGHSAAAPNQQAPNFTMQYDRRCRVRCPPACDVRTRAHDAIESRLARLTAVHDDGASSSRTLW